MPASVPQADPGAAPSAPPEPPNARLTSYRPWLHRLAMAVVVATFLLVAIGGNVTSKGAGLAVPDWPTTFGYNMFLAPLHVWWEQSDRFWEHFHRLMGSLVGVLTIGLAVWLGLTQWRDRRWLAWAGLGLLGLVCVQGVMGGLRVTELSIALAIVHGITGQLILGLTVLIAAATSWMWLAAREPRTGNPAPSLVDPEGVRGPLRGLCWLAIGLVGVLVVQLVLGALMRHTGASLAIPDFPTAYGGWLPPLNQADLNDAIAAHPRAVRPYSMGDVLLHLSHRLGAAVVTVASLWLIVWLNIRAPAQRPTKWPARWLMLLLGAQIAAGASVIWSGRYPEIATLHQALGAALLAVATWLAIRVHLLDYAAPRREARASMEMEDVPGPTAASPGGRSSAVKEQPA